MVILKFYKNPGLKSSQLRSKLEILTKISNAVTDIEAELCYYIESQSPLNKEQINILKWILGSPFEPDQLVDSTAYKGDKLVIEIGPRYCVTLISTFTC